MQEAVTWMVSLNDRASSAMLAANARAATDITGYGLLGHAAEMANASGVALHIDASAVPLMPNVIELIERNIVPGGSKDNAALHAEFTSFAPGVSDALRVALSDAQTSGGLLISLDPKDVDTLERELSGTLARCAIIGEVREGEGITVS
jgi:selenide,water dikinase